ncbi:leukemia NUP98 fusion partner 1-like [Anguilla anguilla]|uniref:leukemia NUP98 fusion partner 1-like n=1 Tax=Anguilla anguilla TaxID=7936 RepID=UPI0015AAF443|nr:leukemia NUP98 fusion partner 1-like [Anguilla anguilla]
MDNDEDEDGNFTKWMSSYWGHSAGDERAREHRRSFRRPSLPRPPQDRRASLPCQSQLNAMQLNPFHTATPASLSTHTKSRDKTDAKPHPRACPASSDDNSHIKSPLVNSRIGTIQELSESLEKRLHFRGHSVTSLSDAEDLCLICHNEARGRETRCAHRPLKEGKRPEWRLCGSGNRGSSAAGGAMSTVCNGQRSRDASHCVEHEDHRQTHRKLSLRRQR